MNLLHLRYFYEVARTRGFMESSRQLRVSQPAISKMVRLLEQDLGHKLLVRGREGVRLTEAGERLFESASRIFAEATAAREALQGKLKGPLHGEWTVGASDTLAIHVVPDALARLKTAHPKLRVGLFAGTSGQIKTELHYDRCNVGIFFTALKGTEPFESSVIHETEFCIVIAAKNRWSDKPKKLTVADLRSKQVPRIESRHSDYAGGFPAHFQSAKLGLTDAPWLEINQHEIKRQLVLRGHGYAFMVRETIVEDLRSGRMIRIPSPKKLSAPIYSVWRKGRQLDRASIEFIEELKHEFANQLDDV